MLNMPQTASAETTVSRNWSWLEQQKLIRSERDHRIRKIFLLMEDGSGQEFKRATGQGRGFFKLPYAYFTQRWHRELKLAGKATLLICLGQALSQAGFDGGLIPWFRPRERRAFWYGTFEEVPRGVVGARDAAGVRVGAPDRACRA